MRAAGFQTPLSIHLQAEAKRLAYEDRARYYGDPDFSRIPTEWLVSKAYAAERARLIRPDRINPSVAPGQAPSQGDTTYFSVADKDGMMVSMIQSNFRGMGSGLVAGRARLHAPRPRPALHPRGRPPEPLRARQAAVPDHHPRLRHPRRPAVAVVRGDGRRHAAAGPDPDHRQPRRPRPRRPGGGRFPALAP